MQYNFRQKTAAFLAYKKERNLYVAYIPYTNDLVVLG